MQVSYNYFLTVEQILPLALGNMEDICSNFVEQDFFCFFFSRSTLQMEKDTFSWCSFWANSSYFAALGNGLSNFVFNKN